MKALKEVKLTALAALLSLCPVSIFTACGDDEPDTPAQTEDIRPFVKYTAEVSSDLLEFANMEISYYDGNGAKKTTTENISLSITPQQSQTVGFSVNLTPKENLEEIIAEKQQTYETEKAANPEATEPTFTFSYNYACVYSLYDYSTTPPSLKNTGHATALTESITISLSKVKQYVENKLSGHSKTYSFSYDAESKTFTEN